MRKIIALKFRTFEPHQSQKRASPLFTRKQFEHVIRASFSLGSGGADAFAGNCCKYNFYTYFIRFFSQPDEGKVVDFGIHIHEQARSEYFYLPSI